MPVQINEVIIRATVDSQGAAASDHPPTQSNVENGEPFSERELAEKILSIIKEKKER